MNPTIENMYSFIESVEQFVRLVILGQIGLADKYVSIILENLSNVFPEIIKLYDEGKYNLASEDKEYWIAQMGRILEVLDGEDYFAKIDVLYHETCENMLYVAGKIGEE